MGYDLSNIVNAAGRSPVAPVKRTFEQAMGVTNDCNIYYGSVIISTRLYSDEFSRITSDNSEMCGRPFYELFRNANYDFVNIGSYLGFSPAELTVNDCTTGKIYHFGRLNEEFSSNPFRRRTSGSKPASSLPCIASSPYPRNLSSARHRRCRLWHICHIRYRCQGSLPMPSVASDSRYRGVRLNWSGILKYSLHTLHRQRVQTREIFLGFSRCLLLPFRGNVEKRCF